GDPVEDVGEGERRAGRRREDRRGRCADQLRRLAGVGGGPAQSGAREGRGGDAGPGDRPNHVARLPDCHLELVLINGATRRARLLRSRCPSTLSASSYLTFSPAPGRRPFLGVTVSNPSSRTRASTALSSSALSSRSSATGRRRRQANNAPPARTIRTGESHRAALPAVKRGLSKMNSP